MAISKGPIDGGQGGKRGHSNMDHWDRTEAIKLAAKKQRRLQAKSDVKLGMIEFEDETELPEPQVDNEFS